MSLRERLDYTGRTRVMTAIEIAMYTVLYVGFVVCLVGLNNRHGPTVVFGLLHMLGGSDGLIVVYLIRAERLQRRLRNHLAPKCPY